jgi:tetratricopeptide (TPR) repeat protein
MVDMAKGRRNESEAALRDAARLYKRLVQVRPDAGPDDWQSLGRCQTMLGRTYVVGSQLKKAEEIQQQALQIFDKLSREHPDVQVFAYDVGRCYTELANTADRNGRPQVARARYEKAIAILEGAWNNGYKTAFRMLTSSRIGRAVTFAAEGNHARAVAEAEVVARQQNLTSTNIYDIACLYSRSVAVAECDRALSPAERSRLKAQYADRAMDFLRDAVAAGYTRPVQLRTDADLDPIRARDDYRKLMADLEAQNPEDTAKPVATTTSER